MIYCASRRVCPRRENIPTEPGYLMCLWRIPRRLQMCRPSLKVF